MKIFSVLLIFLIPYSFTIAQQPVQNIRGTVTDAASKAPVSFATVVLLDTEPLIHGMADVDGVFVLEKVPVGRYDLQVSFLGYEPVIIKEITVSSAREAIVNVTMKESIAQLNEVVLKPKVSKEEPLNNMASVSARMLSVEEAQRYAGGFDDPARLASSFAGVASSVANNGIVIRGNAPRSLQWKMEGVEIPNPNHFADLSAFGGGGLTALSSQMLANSDFFTGAFPAEYNNALSGVFDISMRRGNTKRRQHTFQLGIIGIDLASEGPFKKEGKGSYLFNYRYSTLSLLQPLLPAEAQGTKYQDFSYKLNLPTKKSGTFSIWGLGLLDQSGQLAEKDMSKWYYLQSRTEEEVRQYMGATGLSHEYFFKNDAEIKTSLAATVNGLYWDKKWLDYDMQLRPQAEVKNTNWNFVLTSAFSKKFSANHNNKTGFTITGLMYDLLLKDAGQTINPPATIVDQSGFSSLLSAYTSSSFHLNDRLSLNLGLNTQYFTLNSNYTIEPRIGCKFQFKENQNIGFGYGLHSRLERLNYYFAKAPGMGDEQVNKDLDFTKAHHFVFSYGRNLSENVILKLEPYYQYLFDIPVVSGTSFSFINLQNQWFLNEKLENNGKGKNYGIDLTLEKYLSKGYYFMITGSLFNSEYKGGDGIWRSTVFNRNIITNVLAGKEWHVGKSKQNVLGVNARLIYQGGERYTPVDESSSHLANRIIYDETRAFSEKNQPTFLAHFTGSFKLNKQRTSHEIALKVLNSTMYGDFFGYRYNYVNRTIDEHREVIFIPNLSYTIEF